MTAPSDRRRAAQSRRPVRKSAPAPADASPTGAPAPAAPVVPLRRDRRGAIVHDIAPADRCFGPEAETLAGLPGTLLMRLAERGAFPKL